jgi:hypothetical protein
LKVALLKNKTFAPCDGSTDGRLGEAEVVRHHGAGEPQLSHGPKTEYTSVLDARRDLAGRRQVRRLEAGRRGDSPQKPVEVAPACAEPVPPLESLTSGC